jgi:uncharacterized membrane protein YfcA
MVIVIFAILFVLSGTMLVALARRTSSQDLSFSGKSVLAFGIGFIADFLDTLGIGSFLVTTSLFKWTGFLKDYAKLPGTLNVAHAVPTIVEALFFITVVEVEPLTLISMVLAAAIGAKVGSDLVVKLNQKRILQVMSVALLLTSLLMIARKLGFVDMLGTSNTAMGLHGIKLVIGIVGNFVLGALMSAGVGLYAPCMVMVYLLGMMPIAAFPIMMTSCAALMPVGGMTFIKRGAYAKHNIWYMIIGGIIGVLVAAIFVKSLSMDVLTWIIIAVGFVTSLTLWRSSLSK